MSMPRRLTDEEKAAHRLDQERRQSKGMRKQDNAERKAAASHAAELQRQWTEFWASPAGQARGAFEGGDHVFQFSINVMSQQAIIVAMVGSTTARKATDPGAILNSVCHEGWELVNGSFVFVEQGQQSRDKFLSSGQNVAIKGEIVGYYLFKRCEANRRVPEDASDQDSTAWDAVTDSERARIIASVVESQRRSEPGE